MLAVLLAAGVGVWLLAGAGGDPGRRHVVVGGVPIDEVHPPSGVGRPGVVVAHGFAGSAKLMAQFGDSLAARGYVVVLLDFGGHGASTRSRSDAAGLARDLDVAVAHLRTLADVDPDRIALVGHSMGAGAVTRYAAAHPEITATVGISLPDSSAVSADRPARLLLLVGAWEFPGFRAAAERTGRPTVVVPDVEHIAVLYAPRTHRETADWLDGSFGATGGAMPSPLRRLAGAALLLLALVAGLHPAARLLLARTPLPVAAPLLVGYAAVSIAVPVHLGLTHAVPAGLRWWLLAAAWAGVAALSYAAERVTKGSSLGLLGIFAAAVAALTGAALAGLAPGFALLVVPLLAVLLLWNVIWSAVLHRFAAPIWLIALVGSLVVAWPMATALPQP